jgi:hypothetical protein
MEPFVLRVFMRIIYTYKHTEIIINEPQRTE